MRPLPVMGQQLGDPTDQPLDKRSRTLWMVVHGSCLSSLAEGIGLTTAAVRSPTHAPHRLPSDVAATVRVPGGKEALRR